MLCKALSVALLGLVAAASAQKTSTFSVCTAAYGEQALGATSSAAADLFTCNGDLPTTTKVGSFAYVCGETTTTEQNNQAACTTTFIINGCTITQFGIFDDEFMPIGAGNYLTTAAHGVKRCPKASSITGMVPVYTDSSGLSIDRYTFSLRGGLAKAPVRA